eukprot:scaffold24919_cov34-Tisochrysis_lutea.AAC.3
MYDQARVRWGFSPHERQPYSHLVLHVSWVDPDETLETSCFVDVGFGLINSEEPMPCECPLRTVGLAYLRGRVTPRSRATPAISTDAWDAQTMRDGVFRLTTPGGVWTNGLPESPASVEHLVL